MAEIMKLTKTAIAEAIVEEFGNALAATLGGTAVPTSPAGSTAALAVALPLTAGAKGTVTMWCDLAGAAAAAKAALMMDEAPDAASIADLVKEIAGQAAGSLVLRPPFESLSFGPAVIAEAAAGSWTPTSAIAIGAVACVIGATADVTVNSSPGSDTGQTRVRPGSDPAPAPAADTLEAVMDVDLPLTVRFGRTVMNLKTLSTLGPGSMVDMGRSPDEPVELLVGERLIARGEVVIVGGNYGVRVTEINRQRHVLEA